MQVPPQTTTRLPLAIDPPLHTFQSLRPGPVSLPAMTPKATPQETETRLVQKHPQRPTRAKPIKETSDPSPNGATSHVELQSRTDRNGKEPTPFSRSQYKATAESKIHLRPNLKQPEISNPSPQHRGFNGVLKATPKTSEVCNSCGEPETINLETRMQPNAVPSLPPTQSEMAVPALAQPSPLPAQTHETAASAKNPVTSEPPKEPRNNETKTRFTKGTWKADEDKLLISLVGKFGPQNWTRIADYIPQRSGKQCRERWHNHLDPNINKKKWTTHEDMILIEAHKK